MDNFWVVHRQVRDADYRQTTLMKQMQHNTGPLKVKYVQKIDLTDLKADDEVCMCCDRDGD